jgi:hypothetical protein
VPTPDEQLATFDLIGRSVEALQRLKPQELRALWLRAQGVRNQRRCNDCCDGWPSTPYTWTLRKLLAASLERFGGRRASGAKHHKQRGPEMTGKPVLGCRWVGGYAGGAAIVRPLIALTVVIALHASVSPWLEWQLRGSSLGRRSRSSRCLRP